MSQKNDSFENQLPFHSSDEVEEAKSRLEEMHNEVNGINNTSSEDVKEEIPPQAKGEGNAPHHYELKEEDYSYLDHHHDHYHIDDDAEADLGLSLSLEGEINFPIEEVWRNLTTNDLLKKWQPSIRINRLESGGSISVLQKGEEREVMLMDVEPHQTFSFVWGDDSVQYEFQAEEGKTLFELTYWFADSQSADGVKVMPWLLLLSDLEAHLSNIEPYNRNKEWALNLTEEINTIIAEKKSRIIEL